MRSWRARILLAGWLVPGWLPAQTPPVAGVEYVTAIRHWSQDGSTRVDIEVTAPVQFRWQRADNPPRILVDLPETRLKLQEKGLVTIPVGDPRVTRIRAAHNQPRMARVVLDLEGPAEYDVKQLSSPFRVVLEVRPAGAALRREAAGSLEKGVSAADPSRPTPGAKSPATLAGQSGFEVKSPGAAAARSNQETKPPAALGDRSVSAADPSRLPGAESPVTLDGQSVSEVKSPAAAPGRPAPEVKSAGALAAKSVAEAKPPVTIAAARPEFRKDPLRNDSPAAEHAASNGGREGRPPADLASKAAETRQAALMEPAPDKPPVPSLPPPKPAGRLSTGERNMIRTLGLKLGRVVIDPGHGGHDQGTAGATGLLEKELVLDVARRLGDLIEERLGSEVLYTRTTDVFVPLEERGAFANERRGDLFISVHANSSPYKSISGAETYYLNFTNVKADLEVAARENASTNKSIFELRELLQKIVLKDKIGESREFAARVQRELASAWSKMNETARNRGVKKAPFVVLIGASMPSILAEIGFVSNARDEALMKKPEQRQKLAEALFRGVSQYAAGLSQTQVAQRAKP